MQALPVGALAMNWSEYGTSEACACRVRPVPTKTNSVSESFPRLNPLARRLLFRVLAYRLQADQLGDLDGESRRLLDSAESPEQAGQRAVELGRRTVELRPGTVLDREWNGRMHRVVVLADGFAWNGKTYPSLSNVAFAITGTRWNGPHFFGLRDKAAIEVRQ
jgi:hypothetical protein